MINSCSIQKRWISKVGGFLVKIDRKFVFGNYLCLVYEMPSHELIFFFCKNLQFLLTLLQVPLSRFSANCKQYFCNEYKKESIEKLLWRMLAFAVVFFTAWIGVVLLGLRWLTSLAHIQVLIGIIGVARILILFMCLFIVYLLYSFFSHVCP